MILFLLIVTVTLVADLWSKHLAFERVAGRPVQLLKTRAGDPTLIPVHDPIVLIPQVLSLRLTTNTGAVFGAGKGRQRLFVVVSVLAVAVIGHVFWRSPVGAWGLHLSLGLILAGALGNLYDRLRFNAVRDFLSLFPDTGLWPWIFNIADSALSVGVAIMVVVMWCDDRPKPTDRTNPG